MNPRVIRWLGALAMGCLLISTVGCSQTDPLIELRALQENKKFKKTIDPLREILDANPDQLEANFLLGSALMATGDSSSAIWPLRRALESEEFVIKAGLMLTRAEMSGRTPRDIINAADRVLEVDPDNSDALILRAQGQIKGNRKEDALDDLDRLKELDPDNLQALIPRVIVLLELEKYDEAELELQAAKEKIESTEEEVGEQIRGRMCIANALFAFEKGDKERGESMYELCLEAYPTNQLVIAQTVSFFDKLEKADHATEILRAAYEESGSTHFRSSLARRMGKQGDYEEQLRLLREEAEERPSARAFFSLADYHVYREEFDEACDAFERAIEVDPEPPAMTRFAYVDTLIAAERFDDARREISSVDQMEMVDLLRGRLKLATGDPVGALASFEKGIRLWPDNAGARFLAAQAAEQVGDFDRAMVEYREALRRRGQQSNTDASIHLARILIAIGEGQTAFPPLHTYLSQRPRHKEALLMLIEISNKLKAPKLVKQSLKRLAVIPERKALAISVQIELLAKDGGEQASIDAALKSGMDFSKPQNAIALRSLMEQYSALGQHETGGKLIASALENDPESHAFHDIAARALQAGGGDPAEIRTHFERAIELNPDYASALTGKAGLLAGAGATDEALAMYDHAFSSDPEFLDAPNAAIALLFQEGRIEEAERRLAELVIADPLDAVSSNTLARSLANRGGDLDLALQYAKRAAYFVTEPEAAETLGWVHLLRGEHDEAIEVLRAVLKEGPEATRARYRLGLALAANGKHASAREEFDAVISADAPEAEQARLEIARLGGADKG